MDKNRKILVAILALMALSAVIALIQVSMTMQQAASAGTGFKMGSQSEGVGVIRIYGQISMSSQGNMVEMTPGADEFVSQLNKFEHDSRIKAVVVRIDSPGGTIAATQEIYQKISVLRKKNIPVIASMGDIAASGGYYVASACNLIYANHGTLTGSIGVIMSAPNLRGLFDKLGIQMTVIKSGRYKDILSTSRDITPEERVLLQTLIDSAYMQFLKDVSLGRNVPIDDIRPVADGRVLDGDMAVASKLVDAIGTYEDALAKARSMGGLAADAPVYEEVYSPFKQMLGAVEGAMGRANPFTAHIGKLNPTLVEYRYMP